MRPSSMMGGQGQASSQVSGRPSGFTALRARIMRARKAVNMMGVPSANLEGGRARIKLAEANFEAAKAEAKRPHALLQYDKIVAPYDCVVTRRLVNPGDLVQAATSTRTSPLFTCQKTDIVRVVADSPEASAAG